MEQSVKDKIVNEDSVCKDERIKRLEWLISNTPSKEYFIFHGGSIEKYLFEETRYCFVYAQFLAAIVLGFSFIEHTLTALCFASGRNDLERANISKILDEAKILGWLSNIEYQNLMKAKKIRNSVIHFRKPLDEETVDFKAVIENKHQYEIIEEDAKYVLQVMLKLIDKNAI
ncbi:hypothetical protein ACSSWA_14740 [Melioribacter sp. Ez-97]|uniref:hypothetical protein n=1 Tax=Melioribacter sp. Ez-97 TaxID=3423434 RepID=UPI003EDAE2C4